VGLSGLLVVSAAEPSEALAPSVLPLLDEPPGMNPPPLIGRFTRSSSQPAAPARSSASQTTPKALPAFLSLGTTNLHLDLLQKIAQGLATSSVLERWPRARVRAMV
jgi:hypothetical protein